MPEVFWDRDHLLIRDFYSFLFKKSLLEIILLGIIMLQTYQWKPEHLGESVLKIPSQGKLCLLPSNSEIFQGITAQPGMELETKLSWLFSQGSSLGAMERKALFITSKLKKKIIIKLNLTFSVFSLQKEPCDISPAWCKKQLIGFLLILLHFWRLQEIGSGF